MYCLLHDLQVALGTHLWRAPWAAYTYACKPADGLVTLQVLCALRPPLHYRSPSPALP